MKEENFHYKEVSRRKPSEASDHKNWIDSIIEESVVEFACQYPAMGQLRASKELLKQGVSISSWG